MSSPLHNHLDWLKDYLKRTCATVFEKLVHVVYSVPLTDDWQTVLVLNGVDWIVPQGQFEVYLYPKSPAAGTFNLVTNDGSQTNLLNYTEGEWWFPASIIQLTTLSTKVFEFTNIDPVTGNVTGSTVYYPPESVISIHVPASHGFSFSYGERILVPCDTLVRFRRVG